MRIAVVPVLILLTGCSDAPTRPTPLPMAPARVTVAGSITNTVSGAPVGAFSVEVDRLPTLIPVSADGFLTRQAWVTAARPTVDLIPEAGFDLPFYRQLVRGALDGRLDPIRRWTQAPSIYLHRAGLSEATVGALERVARDVVPALTGGRWAVQTWETGPEPRPVRAGWIVVALVNVPENSCGSAIIGGGDVTLNTATKCHRDGTIIGTPNLLAHEIGHSLGFWHAPADADLMHSPVMVSSPSARERYHAAIAYARAPGNRDVDEDHAGAVTLQPVMID